MLTHARLKELANYDPATGIFTRRCGVKGSAKGDTIGCVRKKDGYVCMRIDYEDYLAHRVAWFYMTGQWPSKPYIDHINGNPNDNRWSNLREATQTEQNANAKRRKDNVTGARGVSWSQKPKGWRARISVNGDHTLLGIFKSIEDAKWVYDAAARKYFGEFVRGA